MTVVSGGAMTFDTLLEQLQSHLEPLERFVSLFAMSLGEPQLLQKNQERGFRYETPDVRHFCLLKAVRVVSALNASLVLARAGYVQEILTLMRTIAEFTTHIDYVLDPPSSEKHKMDVENYIEAFFADCWRDPALGIKRAQVPQGAVHEAIGATLDKLAQQYGDGEDRVPAMKLLSNVYRAYSNVVHGKYPEIMDLFGGRPGRFHLRGMGSTPKEVEAAETVETFIVTAINMCGTIIQRLKLQTLVESDPVLAKWYGDKMKERS
jgi:hypothetical protein